MRLSDNFEEWESKKKVLLVEDIIFTSKHECPNIGIQREMHANQLKPLLYYGEQDNIPIEFLERRVSSWALRQAIPGKKVDPFIEIYIHD